MDIRGLHAFVTRAKSTSETPTEGVFCFDTTQIPTRESGPVDITKIIGNSAIKIIDALISHGYFAKVSDVHIDPRDGIVMVRMRIDGILQDVYTIPIGLHSEVISRIKVMAGLRIDEHYMPHDGRFRSEIIHIKQSTTLPIIVDVRVSITPTYCGENAVLRLLTNMNNANGLPELGFSNLQQQIIQRALARTHGMILATGPTGSGKTTTLYTLISQLNTPDVSIITLEDPIEYSIHGVRQIQVNPAIGFTFGTGLRAVVRQDPDIVMVGEVRDTETARLAVNTALTGHLVLSSIHTNDAAATIVRLLDMDVEPYLIASTVTLVIGQRLVRKICIGCREKIALTDSELLQVSKLTPLSLLHTNPQFYRGRGCGECIGTGYRGRIGVYELLQIDEVIRERIVMRASADEIRIQACKQGMEIMITDALLKARQGITTLEETLRLTHE
ncbi:MAG: pilB [Candidatus Kaiserbacteria bacterium]|nr:pilB [Candidatus Kaiserbacteria bacterium]